LGLAPNHAELELARDVPRRSDAQDVLARFEPNLTARWMLLAVDRQARTHWSPVDEQAAQLRADSPHGGGEQLLDVGRWHVARELSRRLIAPARCRELPSLLLTIANVVVQT